LLLQARSPEVRDDGDRLRAGAGLTAWRQRPAPVRCRARGSGPRCRLPAASAPFHPCPGGGLPLVPLLPLRCSAPMLRALLRAGCWRAR